MLLGGRVDEALACTEAEVAGVTEVVLQGLAQGIGLVYGEAREHLHEATGIAHLRGRMGHGAVALCGGKVGGVDDGDGLLVGRQHLQGYAAQALGSTRAVSFDTQAEGLGMGRSEVVFFIAEVFYNANLQKKSCNAIVYREK